MKEINEFLNRILKRVAGHRNFEIVVAAAVEEVLGVSVKSTNVFIKGDVIFLKLDPVIKNEAIIKNRKIIDLIKKNLPNSRIKEIR